MVLELSSYTLHSHWYVLSFTILSLLIHVIFTSFACAFDNSQALQLCAENQCCRARCDRVAAVAMLVFVYAKHVKLLLHDL
jgi:hypothetical protein